MTLDQGFSWAIGLVVGKVTETIGAEICPVEGLPAPGRSVMLVYVNLESLNVMLLLVSSLTHHSTGKPWEAWVGALMLEVYRLPVTSGR